MPRPLMSSAPPSFVVPIDSTTGKPLDGALRDGTDATRAASVSGDGELSAADRRLHELLEQTNRLLLGLGQMLAHYHGELPFEDFLPT